MKRQPFSLLMIAAVILCASTSAWARNGSYDSRITFSFGTSVPSHGYIRHHHHSHWPRVQQFGPVVTYGPQWHYIQPPVVLPYVYSPQIVVRAPAPAPVYIEQSPPVAESATTLEAGYWYYCGASNAYYPYVRECPEAWLKVAPVPGTASGR